MHVPSRALSRSTKTQLGVASVVGGIVLLGGSQGLLSVAKGAVFGVGALALLVGGGVAFLRRRLYKAATFAALAQSSAQVCAQFLLDNEPRLTAEIGTKAVHAVLASTEPHGTDDAAVAMHFSLLTGDDADDLSAEEAAAVAEAGARSTWRVSLVVRYDSLPDAAHPAPVGRVVEAVLHGLGARTVDLLQHDAAPSPQQRRLGAIDADFEDLSHGKKGRR